jgi:predicted RNase H-like HicB family nuclease
MMVSDQRIYQAVAERDGRWWMVAVPELSGLTQARSLSEAEKMVRSLIAVTTDTSPDEFGVELTIDSVGAVGPVSLEVRAISDLRARADEELREAAGRAAALAKGLADEGLTVRDIGSVLGVSFQRAHQLISA